MYDFFTSYSYRDTEIVRLILQQIKKKRFSIFFEIDTLSVAGDLIDTILNNITNCKYFLLILSPNSISSKIICTELQYALNRAKMIIPVFLNCSPRDFFQENQWTENALAPYELLELSKKPFERLSSFSIRIVSAILNIVNETNTIFIS